MKQQRKQELQTNDLAQAITDVREFLNRYGNYVIMGVVAIAVIIILFTYIRGAQATAVASGHQDVRSVQFRNRDGSPVAPEQGREAVEKLRRIADEAKSPALAQRALLDLADGALFLAYANPRSVDATLLDEAEEACKTLLDRFPEHHIIAGRALCGLATIEADRFVGDEGPAHKKKARGYWEKIRDDSRFNGTPFMMIALDKINRIDDIFGVVQMVEKSPDTMPPGARKFDFTQLPSYMTDGPPPPPLLARPGERSAPVRRPSDDPWSE